MLRYLPLIVSAIVIVGATVFNGVVTNRWTGGVNAKAEAYAAYLRTIPDEIGPWIGQDLEEVDSRIKQVAGVVGEPVSRRYEHAETGRVVDLWLICGHSSQIVRHTPDVCYPAADFRPEEKSHHHEIVADENNKGRFWTSLFHRSAQGGDTYVRVFWGWHKPRAGGPVLWESPGHHVPDARDRFAGSKALFKIYFTSQATSGGEAADESPAIDFAKDFLPVINGLLADAAEGKPVPGAAPAGEPTTPETAADETAADAA